MLAKDRSFGTLRLKTLPCEPLISFASYPARHLIERAFISQPSNTPCRGKHGRHGGQLFSLR